MNRFLKTLRDSGYRQFYLAFGDANFRRADWLKGLEGTSGLLRDLATLFLLQEPLPKKSIQALFSGELIGEFLDCGVLLERGGHYASNSFYLIYCRSQALLCQMTAHPFAYFGDDSLALASLQTPAPSGTVLDLCCGPGIQSFVAAAGGASVTGVEIKKETWRIAELNRRLNGAEQRVQFVCASAEEFAKTNRAKFDRILFNPPLVPMIPGRKFAFVGHGGGDGLEVTRKIIHQYHDRISEQGCMEFIGMGLGRSGRPDVRDELQTLATKYKLTGRVHLLSEHPIKPFAPLFESCVSALARDNALKLEDARALLLRHFTKLKSDSYWLFFASLNRPANARDKSLKTIDLTKSFWGSWFV